jgi:hypothetical protein
MCGDFQEASGKEVSQGLNNLRVFSRNSNRRAYTNHEHWPARLCKSDNHRCAKKTGPHCCAMQQSHPQSTANKRVAVNLGPRVARDMVGRPPQAVSNIFDFHRFFHCAGMIWLVPNLLTAA